MDYKIQSENDKNEKGKKIIKYIIFFILVLALMAVSFGAGLYLPGRFEIVKGMAKNEAIYLGKVTGIYSKAPEEFIKKLESTEFSVGNGSNGQNNLANNEILVHDVSFDLFWDAWDLLKKEYVDKDKLNEKEMFYGAIKGMVEATKDPYTVFMDPKLSQEFAESFSGTFEGIGAEIGIRKDIVTIVAPLPDSPAEKAGLKAGDKIYGINGESTSGFSIEEAVRKIRGPKGSEVKLMISRDGLEKAKEIKIIRDVILIKSVKTELRGDKIFVIKITGFNDDTEALFEQAVNEAVKANPKGIVLDLRNNPGGYLDTAVAVASEWVKEGIIVTEEFSKDKKNEFKSNGKARLKDYPTVVLVNQGSASASEIVAGALQNSANIKLIGMKTFGKGTVQTIEDLKDGSSIKITVAKWLTPKGNYINEKGINPDIEVDLTEDDANKGKDPQTEKALELLGKK